MNTVILDDRQTQGRIILPHTSGLVASTAVVLWFEPDAACWPLMKRWAKRSGVVLHVVPVRLGPVDGVDSLRLSTVLAMLHQAGHTTNVILRAQGVELPLLEDCHAQRTLAFARQVFVRWGFDATLAEHRREARLQDQCKGLVRLESI